MEDILLDNDLEDRLKNLGNRRIFKQMAVIFKVLFATGSYGAPSPNLNQFAYYSATTRPVNPSSQLCALTYVRIVA